jgi:hypothetical protein
MLPIKPNPESYFEKQTTDRYLGSVRDPYIADDPVSAIKG